jgi:hypothetical protein
MWIEFPCPTNPLSRLDVGTTAGREVRSQLSPCPRCPCNRKIDAPIRDERRLLR